MPLARAVRTKSSPNDSIIDAREYRVYAAALATPTVNQAATSPDLGRNVAYRATSSATTKNGTEPTARAAATVTRSVTVPRRRAAWTPVSTPRLRYTAAPPATIEAVTGTA